MHAAFEGQTEAVHALLAAGADATAKSSCEPSASYSPHALSLIASCVALLFSPHIVPQCSTGKNAAEAANDAGHLDLAKTLREAAEEQKKAAADTLKGKAASIPDSKNSAEAANLDLAKTLREAAEAQKKAIDVAKVTAEAKAASEVKSTSSKLTQAQMAAAVAVVSQTRGKPILRSRISFVGEGAAGKTSVIRAMCSGADDDPASTIGIDRSCVEFDITAVDVDAEGGQVCLRRCVQLFAALFVACALKLLLSAVDHKTASRHPVQ
jgi:hypothetical protein